MDSFNEDLRTIDDVHDEGSRPDQPKMTEEQRKLYLKRLYKLASDHYTPEAKEEYLKKLYAERADASMIRAAAMQVYRARKAKEKENLRKERSPTGVASPLDTKTAMDMIKERFVQLFSCADLKVVDDDGMIITQEDPALFCGMDEKFLREIENDIVEKHFSSRHSSMSHDHGTKPLNQRGKDGPTETGFTKYGVASLDRYLSNQAAEYTKDGFDESNLTNSLLKTDSELKRQPKGTMIPRELNFEDEFTKRTAPHTIYISNEASASINDNEPASNISTTNLDTKDGSKTVLIVPSTMPKRKTKGGTNKTNMTDKTQIDDDNELPFDEHNKVKTDRITKLYDSVKNLPFDEASFTIAWNAEDFVDHLARESPITSPDFFDEMISPDSRGLRVDELALDVDYHYRR